MMDAYGRAVVDERTNPLRHAEVALYLRREYGLGTGLGYLYAEANGAAAPPKGDGMGRRMIRRLAEAARALVPANGRAQTTAAPQPTE